MKSDWFLPALLILCFGVLPCPAHAADSWTGRKLRTVLDELRAAGLPLLYSTQVVSDELIIHHDPEGVLQLERLRLALQEHGLALQPLVPASQGYAIVRSATPVTVVARSAVTAALEEVTVFASRYNLRRTEDHTAHLAHATLEKTAGIEQDVLRSVQYLPGTSANSLSSLSHVRGGYEDENLVRFDGVELYNPVHLKNFQGLFGLLDPDWVQSLNFYSGAYPVRFGNHNSAVIDITPRHTGEPQVTVGASLLYTRALSTGSYHAEAGQWLLGYRRSNLPEVLNHAEVRIGEPEFEDLLLRHSYDFGTGTLRIGALRLNDDLGLQSNASDARARVQDHDSYVWMGWQQAWSAALDFNLLLSHSQLSSRRGASLNRFNIASGTLSDRRDTRMNTLEGELNLRSSAQTQWQWGMRLNQGSAAYQYHSAAQYAAPLQATFSKPDFLQRDFARQYRSPDYASYLSVNRQWQAWQAELGLRYDRFPYLEHGTQFSPRLNVHYTFNADSSLHASAGQYAQAQTLNLLEGSADAPRFQAPQLMQQYILGWTRMLSPTLQLRLEGYHKQGRQIAPHEENQLTFITLTPDLEIDRHTVTASRSRAEGIELSLSAPAQQHFGWWLNYSWSRVHDQINGHYVPRSWDQPHALTAGANWTRNRWILSGSSSWHSGWAYTPVLISSEGSSAVLGARNSQRFADFFSLELRAQYTLPIRTARMELFMELRNAFNHRNECCRDLSVTISNGTPRILATRDTTLPLLPIAGFNLRF